MLLVGVLALGDIDSVNLTSVLVQMICSLRSKTVLSLARATFFRAVDLVRKVDGREMSFEISGAGKAAFTPRL